jgi:putative transposase
LFDSNRELTKWKQEFPELYSVYSNVLQNAQVRVDIAFKKFFKRVKKGNSPGYPRFKGKGQCDTFTYSRSGYKIKGKFTVLTKIGRIKTIFDRPISGKIKTVTVRKTSTQKWFVSFICEDVSHDDFLSISDECVGIDLGLKTFATLSNGEKIENPKFYRNEEANLANAQRKEKPRKVIARIHERIANKREDFIQKLSCSLVNRYGVICFEDLSIDKMAGDPRFAKGIMDAAWRKLVQYTTYKAENAGRRVVLVDPKNTSQMCSRCGQIVTKDLSVRIHDCPHCGYTADRDLNAAINILRLGLQSHIKARG